jgi:ethanolamine utilization protein EutQ (cupin superfamily)
LLVDTGALRAGLTRFSTEADPTPLVWVLPATEVLLVLEREAQIEIEDGPQLELKPGDIACLPKER